MKKSCRNSELVCGPKHGGRSTVSRSGVVRTALVWNAVAWTALGWSSVVGCSNGDGGGTDGVGARSSIPSGASEQSAGGSSDNTTPTTDGPVVVGPGSNAGVGSSPTGVDGLSGSSSVPGGGTVAPSADGLGGSAGGTGGGTVSEAAGGSAGMGVVPDGVGGTVPGSGGSGGVVGSGSSDVVTRSASTFEFRHFPIEASATGVWNGPESPAEEPTSTTYDTVVLENGYLRVTLLPDYGGRVLSIVHKPTGRELLYQNPIGAPYLMYQDIFYYDYLVIMGGIFPSFPEPEHGRYWNQPYAFEVVSESDEAITVRMSRQDDLDLVEGVPARYDVGRTDVLVEVDVTLRAGSSGLELGTKLTNTRDTPVPRFEYWMVNTLAPGSPPGDTAIGLNTRILAAMDQVHLLETSWAWFGDAEERVADEVFKWNNLSHFENWADQGTAFANPSYQANWWGLINYDNDMGILRVSDNVQTPGLKLWTFGKQSLDIDLSDSDEWLRPTIEMWYGITPEFWDRGAMAAGEIKQWSETYFATMGLREVTAASEYGAMYLSSASIGDQMQLTATATLTLPDQTVKAVLRLDGNVIDEQDVVVASKEPTTVSAMVPSADAAVGAVFEVEFLIGTTSLLAGQAPL